MAVSFARSISVSFGVAAASCFSSSLRAVRSASSAFLPGSPRGSPAGSPCSAVALGSAGAVVAASFAAASDIAGSSIAGDNPTTSRRQEELGPDVAGGRQALEGVLAGSGGPVDPGRGGPVAAGQGLAGLHESRAAAADVGHLAEVGAVLDRLPVGLAESRDLARADELLRVVSQVGRSDGGRDHYAVAARVALEAGRVAVDAAGEHRAPRTRRQVQV